MRDYTALAELSEKFLERNGSKLGKRMLQTIITFYRGIAFLNLARTTGESKYRRLGEQAVATIAEYEVTMSTWNYENKRLLLQAELHYLDGRLEAAEKAYQASIKSARDHRFIHEEALAHELYGVFCVENGMGETGLMQLRIAMGKYEEWGARRKANEVQLYLAAVVAVDAPDRT
jgi:hypothetical protein